MAFEFFKRLSVKKDASNQIFSFLNSSAPPMMSEREYMQAYRGYVYACVNAIADEVAGTALKLQKTDNKGNWEDVEHPALDLLKNVNPFWSSFDLKYATAAFNKIHGNTFWYMVRNGNGKPSEIWVLDPTKTYAVKSEKDYIGGYVFITEKGEKVPLKTEEVIHFKKFNPKNPFRGMGTVEAGGLPIDIDNFASQTQRNFFGNSAMPSLALTFAGTLNQDQYDRIRANWDNKYKGVDNAGKLAILEGGGTVTPLQSSMRDMQFIEGRAAIRDEILAIFRVPKSMLGMTTDVNRATAEAAQYQFAKNVVRPEIQFITSTLNEFYLPMFGLNQSQYRMFYEDPVPENIELKLLTNANGMTHAYMTINEARANIGLDPIDGGDELLIPTLDTPTPANSDTDNDLEEEEDKSAPTEGTEVKKKSIKALDNNSYVQTQIKLQIPLLLNAFKSVETLILKNLNKKKSKSFLHQLNKAVDPTNELVNILFSNFPEMITLIFNATDEKIKEIYSKSGRDALAQVGIDQSFDLTNESALDFLNNHALEQATQVLETVKDEMGLYIQEGVESGATNREIAQSISDFFDETESYRADRIARTETITAYSKGALEGYAQSGVVYGTTWDADANACPICEENAAAGVVALGESFPSGDSEPAAHPNAVLEGTTFYSYGELQEMVSADDYDGEAIVIKTSEDHEITIGVNHPMLTQRGLVKARELTIDDYLLYDTRINDSSPFASNSDFKQVPFVEDAFNALVSGGGTSLVATPTHDLHGDKIFCKGEVNVIKPADGLLFKLDSLGIEQFREGDFMEANMQAVLKSGDSTSSFALNSVNLSSSGLISSSLSCYNLLHIQSIHYVKVKCKAFDASTTKGLYNSNGFVVSNCECGSSPVTKSEDQLLDE